MNTNHLLILVGVVGGVVLLVTIIGSIMKITGWDFEELWDNFWGCVMTILLIALVLTVIAGLVYWLFSP